MRILRESWTLHRGIHQHSQLCKDVIPAMRRKYFSVSPRSYSLANTISQEYCLETGLADNSCTDATDISCQCAKSDELVTLMTPCLQNLCSSSEATQAVLYWQSICMGALTSAIEVTGYATGSLGLRPTIAATDADTTLLTSALVYPTLAPSIESLLKEFSVTGMPTDYLVSESDSTSWPTGGSFRPSSTDSPSSSSSSLSTGAKAGIAIGAVAIALIVTVVTWIFCRRRKQSKVAAPETYTGSNEVYSEKVPVVSTTQQAGPPQYPKSPTRPIQREPVEQNNVYPEMDGGTPVSPVNVAQGNELEGQYWPAGHERRGELAG